MFALGRRLASRLASRTIPSKCSISSKAYIPFSEVKEQRLPTLSEAQQFEACIENIPLFSLPATTIKENEFQLESIEQPGCFSLWAGCQTPEPRMIILRKSTAKPGYWTLDCSQLMVDQYHSYLQTVTRLAERLHVVSEDECENGQKFQKEPFK